MRLISIFLVTKWARIDVFLYFQVFIESNSTQVQELAFNFTLLKLLYTNKTFKHYGNLCLIFFLFSLLAANSMKANKAPIFNAIYLSHGVACVSHITPCNKIDTTCGLQI